MGIGKLTISFCFTGSTIKGDKNDIIMNRNRILLKLVTIFICGTNMLSAQDSLSNHSRNYGWVDAGLGYLNSSDLSGSSASVCFSHLSQLGLITLRFVDAVNAGIYPALPYITTYSQLSEVGILYGRALNSDFLFASGSVGLGVMWLESHKAGTNDRIMAIGLPLEFEASLIPLPVFAVGAKFVADINNKSTLAAGYFCLRVGLLRYAKPHVGNQLDGK